MGVLQNKSLSRVQKSPRHFQFSSHYSFTAFHEQTSDSKVGNNFKKIEIESF